MKKIRDIAVVGIGMTRFGQLWDVGVREMAEEALLKALKDAGAKPGDIQAAYCGSMGMAADAPMMIGQIVLEQVGIAGIPISRVENACASGSNAFREAWLALQSGLYDVAIAVGVEKMSAPSLDYARFASRFGGGDVVMEGSMGFFPPGIFAMAARKQMERGITRKQLALVAVKNHRHGALNPLAHYQKEVSVEDVLGSRPVADPLNVLDCSPISDGCSVAIIASKAAAKKFTGTPVWIRASAQVSGTYRDEDGMFPDTTRRAAKEAYDMAGIGPEDLDLAEVHDCFTPAEIMHYEDLGFCTPGDGGKFVEEGRSSLGGPLPVNASGGLLSKGHPLGATGIAQIIEVTNHLRGRAGKRQVDGARIGLTHNGGGFRHMDAGAVLIHILGK